MLAIGISIEQTELHSLFFLKFLNDLQTFKKVVTLMWSKRDLDSFWRPASKRKGYNIG